MKRSDEILTADLADRIVQKLAGGMRMKEIAAELGVAAITLYSWEKTNLKGFGDQMTLARQVMANTLMEEMLEIADDCPMSATAISRAALQIKTRQSVITMLKPSPASIPAATVDEEAGVQQTPVQFLRDWQSKNPALAS